MGSVAHAVALLVRLEDLVISSSWIVENGWTTQIGGVVKAQSKSKRLRFKRVTCSKCGERGHLKTTCGLTAEERAAKRKERPRKKPTASSQVVQLAPELRDGGPDVALSCDLAADGERPAPELRLEGR